MPNEMAEKVGDLYFKMNRNGIGKMVVLYDPNAVIPITRNHGR